MRPGDGATKLRKPRFPVVPSVLIAACSRSCVLTQRRLSQYSSKHMDRALRAQRHAALGDERRLAIVDRLALGDLTVAELGQLVDMRPNLLAHHLEVLEKAGLIDRRVSEGDHRRRYVSLRWQGLPVAVEPGPASERTVAFVCTHNSARSQFAAALWRARGRGDASSAGTDPADRVHPLAVQVANEFGLDLSEAVPSGIDALPERPDMVISVCDRAREAGVPNADATYHWSIPDPALVGTVQAFRSAFGEISARINRESHGPA